MPEYRQLAAIMFTDIVGYSALMSKDEILTMEVLERNRGVNKTAIGHFQPGQRNGTRGIILLSILFFVSFLRNCPKILLNERSPLL